MRKGNQELRKKIDLPGFISPILPSDHRNELARVPQDRADLSGDLDSDRKVHRSERGPSQVKSPRFGRDCKSVHKWQEAPDAKLRLNALGKVKPGWIPKTPADKDFIQRGARLQEP